MIRRVTIQHIADTMGISVASVHAALTVPSWDEQTIHNMGSLNVDPGPKAEKTGHFKNTFRSFSG